jgi:hypothetical protein
MKKKKRQAKPVASLATLISDVGHRKRMLVPRLYPIGLAAPGLVRMGLGPVGYRESIAWKAERTAYREMRVPKEKEKR